MYNPNVFYWVGGILILIGITGMINYIKRIPFIILTITGAVIAIFPQIPYVIHLLK